jgi:acyl-CoA thioester hydrolase
MTRTDQLLDPAAYPHIEPIAVRFRDLDPLGHVNNAVYATYCETARIGYLRAVVGSVDRRPGIVIAELQMTFRAPVLLGDALQCGVRIASLGRKSFVMDYLLIRTADAAIVATARSVQVAYDLAAGRSIWLSEDFRRQVEAFEGRELPRSPSA